MTREGGRQDPNGETYVAHTLRGGGFDASEDGTGRGTPLVPVGQIQGVNRRSKTQHGLGVVGPEAPGFTLTASDQHAVAFHMTQDPISGDVAPSLGATSGGMGVACFDEAQITSAANRSDVRSDAPAPAMSRMSRIGPGGVRRLTPRECERLQGFPDDYTAIPKASDSARYEALGNSMAVPCMSWIGRRIAAIDALAQSADLSRREGGR